MRHSRFVAMLMLLSLVPAACSSQTPQESVDRANAYFKEGKYPEAIIEYRKALNTDPKLGEARAKLAEAYEKNKDIRNAFGEYIRAADALPDREDLQLKAGQLLLAAQRFEDARARAMKVLEKNPNNVDAQILKGSAAAGMKDLDGAIKDVEEAVKMAPESDRAYAQLGVLKLAKGAPVEAEEAFKKAVEVKPDSVDAQLALASFFWASGRMQEAEPPLRQAIALDAKNLTAQRALATYLRAANRAPEAEAPLKAVVDIAKDNLSKLALADYYIGSQRNADAMPILKEVASAKDGLADATLRIAAIEYSDNKKAEAHKRIDDVLKETPKHTGLLELKGRLLMLEQKYDEALTSAKAAVTSDANSATAHYLVGLLQQAKRDNEGAIASFTEVLRLNPSASAAQLKLAELNLAKGSPKEAVAFAEQANRASGNNPAARQVLVRTLASNGDVRRATEELDKLLKEFPKAATLHVDAARIALLKNDRKGARTSFETARTLDPNSYDAVGGLVALALADKNPTEAQGLIDPLIQKAPTNTQLLFMQSAIHGATGKAKEMEGSLRKILEVDADNLQAYGSLATLFVRTGRLDDAKKEFNEIWTRQPKNVAAPTMIALLYEAQKNQTEAQKLYEKVISIDPNAAVAANNLAWLYAEKGGNLDVALQLAQTAAQKLPNSPQVHDTLGWVYLKKGLASLAVTSFETSVKQDPNDAGFAYHLGLAYQRAGDNTKARAALESALKKKPDYAEAKEALATLN